MNAPDPVFWPEPDPHPWFLSPSPPQKKNTLRVKVGWPVYDPIFSFFFPWKMCMVLCKLTSSSTWGLLFTAPPPRSVGYLAPERDFCCWPGMWSTLLLE